MKEPVKFRIVTDGHAFKVQRWGQRRVWKFWRFDFLCEGDFKWIDDYPPSETTLDLAQHRLDYLDKLWNPRPWHPIPHPEPVIAAIQEANEEANQ